MVEFIETAEWNELSTSERNSTTIPQFGAEGIECDKCGASVGFDKLNGYTTTIFICPNLHLSRTASTSEPRIDFCFACFVELAIAQKQFASSFVIFMPLLCFFHAFCMVFLCIFYAFFMHFLWVFYIFLCLFYVFFMHFVWFFYALFTLFLCVFYRFLMYMYLFMFIYSISNKFITNA